MSGTFDVHLVHSTAGRYELTAAAVYGDVLFAGCDDGALRLFDIAQGALDKQPGKPELTLLSTIAKFSRDTRKGGTGIQQLSVVHEWAALVALVDGVVHVYRLDSLQSPEWVVPAAKNCVMFAASGEMGYLAVATRTSVTSYRWTGAVADWHQQMVIAPQSKSQQRNAIGPTAACFSDAMVYSVNAFNPSAPPDATRLRRNSTTNMLAALGQSAPSNSAAITRLQWLGTKLSVAVVCKSDVSLHRDDEDVEVVELQSQTSSTGYKLCYLLLHPESGRIKREFYAGSAPPLDASGTPSIAAGDAAIAKLFQGPSSTKAAAATTALPMYAAQAASTFGMMALLRQGAGDAVLDSEDDVYGVGEAEEKHADVSDYKDNYKEDRDSDGGFDEDIHDLPSEYMFVTALDATGDNIGCVVSDDLMHPQQHVPFSSYPIALSTVQPFPYILATQHDGVSILHASARSEEQRVKMSSPFALLMCPNESRVRNDFAARRHTQYVDSCRRAVIPDSVLTRLQSILTTPPRVFAVAHNGVVLLRMVPIVMQVAGFLSVRPPRCEDALHLCEQFDVIKARFASVVEGCNDVGLIESVGDTQMSVSSLDLLGGLADQKTRQIRAQLGYQKFAEGNFSTALKLLFAADEPVVRVLSLFPQLLPSRLNVQVSFPMAMPVMIDAVLHQVMKPLLKYLVRQRKKLGCDTPHPNHTPPTLDDAFFGDATDSASSPAPDAASSLEFTPPVLVDTVLLTTALWYEAYLKHVTESAGSAAPSPTLQEDLSEVQQVVWTLLLSNNCVDEEEAEAQLTAFGKQQQALVALYRGKGLHDKAISLLTQQVMELLAVVPPHQLTILDSADDEATSEPEYVAVVRRAVESHMTALSEYVLGPGNQSAGEVCSCIQQLLSHAQAETIVLETTWLLAELVAGTNGAAFPPDRALQLLSCCWEGAAPAVFWRLRAAIPPVMQPPQLLAEGIPVVEPLPHVALKPLIASVVLESAVLANQPVGEELEKVLLLNLIDIIKPLDESNTHAELYNLHSQRLLHLLQVLHAYRPLEILLHLPQSCVKHRIELLRRLGRHEDALHILVTGLRDHAAAEEYCDNVAKQAERKGVLTSRGEVSAVYSALLRAYFPKHVDSAVRTEDATSVVERVVPFVLQHMQQLEPSRALSELPGDVPLHSISTLITAGMNMNIYTRRSTAFARHLAEVEHLNASVALVNKVRGATQVDRATVCAVCNKKLAAGGAATAFTRTPDGKLIHLACSTHR